MPPWSTVTAMLRTDLLNELSTSSGNWVLLPCNNKHFSIRYAGGETRYLLEVLLHVKQYCWQQHVWSIYPWFPINISVVSFSICSDLQVHIALYTLSILNIIPNIRAENPTGFCQCLWLEAFPLSYPTRTQGLLGRKNNSSHYLIFDFLLSLHLRAKAEDYRMPSWAWTPPKTKEAPCFSLRTI